MNFTAPSIPVGAFNNDLVTELAKATRSPQGFMFVTEAQYTPLVAVKFAEVNLDGKDLTGKVPARLTEAGLSYADSLDESQPLLWNSSSTPDLTVDNVPELNNDFERKADQMSDTQETFEIIENFVLPTPVRKQSAAVAKYPFDQLPVNGAFKVLNTPERPNAYKTMLSAVSAANKRYSEKTLESRVNRNNEIVPVMKPLRVFQVRAYLNDKQEVIGAIVGRTA